jgi:hypothetical protein
MRAHLSARPSYAAASACQCRSKCSMQSAQHRRQPRLRNCIPRSPSRRHRWELAGLEAARVHLDHRARGCSHRRRSSSSSIASLLHCICHLSQRNHTVCVELPRARQLPLRSDRHCRCSRFRRRKRSSIRRRHEDTARVQLRPRVLQRARARRHLCLRRNQQLQLLHRRHHRTPPPALLYRC